MRFRNFLQLVVLLAAVCIGANCNSDRRCAYDLTGQIAEHSAVFDFFPVEGNERILTLDEKRELLSKISLPSCAMNVSDLESKYEIGTTKGTEIVVWPSGEEVPERFRRIIK
jgi:hypothetical protein